MKWGLLKSESSPYEKELGSLRKNFDLFFDDFFNYNPMSLEATDWSPKVDILENENEIKVKAEIPGMNQKDINLEIKNNILIISGEKKEEEEKNDKNYYFSERKFGSFKRSISISSDIDNDNINAKYKNGVLKIVLPKKAKTEEKSKTIKIEAK